MKKNERIKFILDTVNVKGYVSIQELAQHLNVSNMTIRRYLTELEEKDELIKVHGGAESKLVRNEKSQFEKQSLYMNEKKEIADIASHFIKPGETIFISSGTTLEQLAYKINEEDIRVVTNSWPVFVILNQKNFKELVLVGGTYRERTGAFVGKTAFNCLESMNFTKAFISCNAIYGTNISTFTESAGDIQTAALNKAQEKFLLVDHSKFNKIDFYQFYDLENINYLITDHNIEEKTITKYSQFVKILSSKTIDSIF